MPQKEKNAALREFRESRPDLEAEFEREQAFVVALNNVIKKGPFDLGSGDTDLYQAFAWRNWQLLRNSGRFAVVIPRSALSGSALAQWRREILTRGAFADVCFLLNNQQWVFADVHPQYTIGLTVGEKGGQPVVRWAGPFNNESDFLAKAQDLAEVPAEEFLSWSNNVAFPLIPDPLSARIFRQMKRSPRFDQHDPEWEFRPFRELDATNDKSLLEFDTDSDRGRVPIYTGASFNLWNPAAGPPYAYAKESVLRRHFKEKLASAVDRARSVYFGMKFDQGVLPMDSARLAFRDIARATDSRTMICCLLPPGVSAVHKAPLIVRRAGTAKAEAALLGIMSSIPFDWATRRWVELTMSFELLNSFPVPRPALESGMGARIVQISGLLAAADERYRDWAAEVGVPVGAIKSQAEKDELLAEVDALVSLLYGLTDAEVCHVFATFHRGWDYDARLTAVLKHFGAWKDKA